MIVPNSKYKKFVNLTLGFVMIFIVLSPLQTLIGGFSAPVDEIVDKLTGQINTDVISKEAAFYTESNKQLVISEYKARLNEQTKEKINAGGVFEFISSDFSIDSTEDGFGTILAVSVTLREKAAEPTQKPLIRIEPVSVESVSVFSPIRTGAPEPDSPDILSIKKVISDFYNLSYDNIYITVADDVSKR